MPLKTKQKTTSNPRSIKKFNELGTKQAACAFLRMKTSRRWEVILMTSLIPSQERKCADDDASEAQDDQLERAKHCPQALGEVYRRYAPRITGYVVRRIGNVQEAEDIVANVFLAMV